MSEATFASPAGSAKLRGWFDALRNPRRVLDENGDIVEDADIVCADGGAGGESIPVRNTNTFYLATWAGNTATVTAVPTN